MPADRAVMLDSLLQTLRSCGRSLPTLPLAASLPGGGSLEVESVLRLLPGKRLVARARWQGQPVLAKLFFTRSGFTREQQGFHRLQGSGVATPACLAVHDSEGGGLCLYEYLDNARSLAQAWADSEEDARQQLLKRLLDLLSQCYHAEICQSDLHLDNFMLCDDTLYALDPASCVPCMDAEAREDNLALLVAQLPFDQWDAVAHTISLRFTGTQAIDLLERAQAHWQRRLDAYLSKIQRDCTEVAALGEGRWSILCRRSIASPALVAALSDPVALETGAQILKRGGSATVFAVRIEGQSYIFKRYHYKDIWRRLRRGFRPSRAARSWRIAHALQFAGIATPAPVARVEYRAFGHVAEAWYVAEAVRGDTLQAHWQRHTPTDTELAQLRRLFHTLSLAGLSHGDMKATNLLVQDNRFLLIDYDGARELTGQRLQAALREDRERFLRNWEGAPFLPALREATRP